MVIYTLFLFTLFSICLIYQLQYTLVNDKFKEQNDLKLKADKKAGT